MPSDALLTLQASVSQNTVTTFNGTALFLAAGTPRRGLKARVLLTTATSSTTNTVTWSIDVCYDGVPTTWYSDFLTPAYSLTTTSIGSELFIPFDINPTVIANGTYIRLTCVTAGAGVPAVTYKGDLLIARP
jgi:hypothetical protein